MNLGHLVFNWVANVTVDPHLQVFGASYSTYIDMKLKGRSVQFGELSEYMQKHGKVNET